MFSANESRILVDPLLGDRFGHDGVIGDVYPPRALDVSAFPPIDAVLITHEHEDHFDIPTLNRLSRDIPIYLSSRSSIVARNLLARMGFEVHLVQAGEKLVFGDLEVYTLSPDHAGDDNADEWDVIPFFVRDAAGDGSLFSGVDVLPTEEMERIMECVVGKPGLWCYTNNMNDWSFMFAGKVAEQFPCEDVFSLAVSFIEHHARMRFTWDKPAGSLFAGAGYSFANDRAWLNRHVFRADSAQVAAALAALAPGELFLQLVPGHTIHMRENRIVAVEESTPFVAPAPRAEWPSRVYQPTVELVEDYEPACGRSAITPGELDRLLPELARFAEHIYATAPFKQLYSFLLKELEGKKPTLALVLLTGADRSWHVLEYEPQSCSFVFSASEDPFNDYLAGVECWATDLLDVMTGELSPSALVFGRMRRWNWMPERFHFTIGEIWRFVHPLRRPELFDRLYRKLLAAEPRDVPRIPAARRARAAA